jgi:hypothetical protein
MTVKDLKSDDSSAFLPSFLHKMHQEFMKLPLAVYEDKKQKFLILMMSWGEKKCTERERKLGFPWNSRRTTATDLKSDDSSSFLPLRNASRIREASTCCV